jgi:diadenylate cyclase
METAVFDNLLQGGAPAVLVALAEILVLSYLFYLILLVFRGTRAVPVVLGIGMLAVFYYLSGYLGMGTLHWLLGALTPYVVILLIVIFQTEIRRTLRQFALAWMPTTRASTVVRYEYEDVLFAVATLSQEKVGALIALERETGLRTFVQSGVSLDAHLSSDLLVSIFQRASPLHDGAVIVQRGKIAAAACFLPLTTNPGLMSSLGSRHRAAIGITEESDCLTIAVAEMTGRISVAAGGGIELGVSLDRLRLRLIQHFGPVVPPPRARNLSEETADAGEAIGQLEETGPAEVSDR